VCFFLSKVLNLLLYAWLHAATYSASDRWAAPTDICRVLPIWFGHKKCIWACAHSVMD
jgi:hypothetical protein